MKITLLCITFFLSTLIINAQNWVPIIDFPSAERDDGTSFTINNKAYCGTGLQVGWSATADFYSFDFINENWTSIASLPQGNERQYACGFSACGNGFIFGGTNAVGITLSDLWMYNTVLNTWVQKTSKPGFGLAGSSCFVIDSCAYIIGGKNTSTDASCEVWSYNIFTNLWSRKNNFPFGGRWRASAAELNGKGYLIFGKDSIGVLHNTMYEYNADNDSWIIVTEFPNLGRIYASMNSVESSLSVVGGLDSTNHYYNDLWYYSSSTNQWIQQNLIPSVGRKGGMCFGNYNTLYYTTGIDSLNNRLKQTWKIINPTDVSEINKNNLNVIYPNPANAFIEINIQGIKNCVLKIFDFTGNLCFSQTGIENSTQININKLNNGVYFVSLFADNLNSCTKLVISK